MTDHERILAAAKAQLEKDGYRVVRLDKSYTPDMVAVRHDEILAVEAEAGTTQFQRYYTGHKGYRKNERSQFDRTVVFTSRKVRIYTKQEYEEAFHLHRQGKHFREIGEQLGIPGGTIYMWVEKGHTPWSVKAGYDGNGLSFTTA